MVIIMPKVKCKICGKWFKSKRSLEMHVSKAHNEKPSNDFSEPFQTYPDLSGRIEKAGVVQSSETPVLSSPFESKESRKEISDIEDIFMRVFLANLNYDIPEVSKKWGKFRRL